MMDRIQLVEALNKLDRDTDNAFELRNLYEATNMSAQDKNELRKLINTSNDPDVIARYLAAKYNGNNKQRTNATQPQNEDLMDEHWTDPYDEFESIIDKHGMFNVDAIMAEAEVLYNQHRGDPDWEEAYARWLANNGDDEEQVTVSKVLYVIKDKHGNQLSSPNEDDQELWDRVSARDPDGRKGLIVVAYTGTDESLTESASYELTREELNQLQNEFYQEVLKKDNHFASSEYWDNDDDTIIVEVIWGDWKHEHAYLDWLARQFFNKRGYKVNVYSHITEEDGSDCYSANHYFELTKPETLSRMSDRSLDGSYWPLQEDYSEVEDEWSDPYSYDECYRDIRSATNDFQELKGAIKCKHPQEKVYGMQILKQKYSKVAVSADNSLPDGPWFIIQYADRKRIPESLFEDFVGDAAQYDPKFLDKYFRTVDIFDKSRFAYMKYRGKHIAYDKNRNVVLILFKDSDELAALGKNCPYRVLHSVGLSVDNWKDPRARKEYLDMYIDDYEEESNYLAQDFIQNELPLYQEKGE